MSSIPEQLYYWVVTKYGGRLVILGAYPDEESAQEIGYQRLDSPFRVVALPTRDMSRATRIIKARRLDEGNDDLGEVLSRAKHTTEEKE